MEQVQRVTEAGASVTSNTVALQWQLPFSGMATLPFDSSHATTRACR
jgi:hypothetical protein